MSRDSSGEVQTPPTWTTVLIVLGWVVIAANLVFAVLTGKKLAESAVLVTPAEWVGIGATVLALGGAGLTCGLILISIARSGRRGSQMGRLTLWAKILVIVGVELCAGIPVLLYGMALLGVAAMHDPTTDPVNPLEGRLLLGLGAVSAIPILIGCAMIAAAWLWGRRRAQVNLPEVFS